jgi:hypothetical protein
MAARIFINATHPDFSELAKELRTFADIADECAKSLQESELQREYRTDGFNMAIEGMDAIANLLIGMVGSFNAKKAELTDLRKKINDERARMAVAKIAKAAGVPPPALRVAEPAKEYPLQARKEPTAPLRKASRKKKS